ncbi:hypothetical protein COP2_024477 [Malus domestica]
MEGYPQGNFGPYIRVDWSCCYYQGSIFPARQGSRARRLQGVPVYRGPTEKSVKRGKAELKRKLEEIMNQALSLPGSAQQRRYQLCKRCDHGAILQFKGMFCLGIAGADQLPSKMDLLLWCCSL